MLIGTETKADEPVEDGRFTRSVVKTVALQPGEAHRLLAVAERLAALGCSDQVEAIRANVERGVKPAMFRETYVPGLEGMVANMERSHQLKTGKAQAVTPQQVKDWAGDGGVGIISDHERRAVMSVPRAAGAVITAALQDIADELGRRGYGDVTQINGANASTDTLELKKRFQSISGLAYRFASSLYALRRGAARADMDRAHADMVALQREMGRDLPIDLERLAAAKQLSLFADLNTAA